MWSELTLSPTKFGQSFRWTDTYAGYTGESEILESLYTQGVKEGKRLDLGIDGLEAYANGRLFVLWNTQPRLAWQTQEYYRQESSTLTQSEFDRMHGNQWVSSEQTFVPREWWDACQVKTLSPIERHHPVVVSLDAGVSNDCFAMVALSRRDERREKENTVEIKSFPQVRYARAWKPPKGGKLDFDNAIEPELRRLCETYHVIEVCYDEYQLHSFCTSLARKLKTFFRPFPQGTDRLIADKGLQDLIRERRIEHQGEPELAEHIQNANARTEGDKLRIVKRSGLMKIDLAVALSMASDRILRLW
jgi:phage terminase large subunit-like protein